MEDCLLTSGQELQTVQNLTAPERLAETLDCVGNENFPENHATFSCIMKFFMLAMALAMEPAFGAVEGVMS